MQVQRDVDAGSERRGCRLREILIQVQRDADAGSERY
jgi:hypothetical protein